MTNGEARFLAAVLASAEIEDFRDFSLILNNLTLLHKLYDIVVQQNNFFVWQKDYVELAALPNRIYIYIYIYGVFNIPHRYYKAR